jgi:hypothetical protein
VLCLKHRLYRPRAEFEWAQHNYSIFLRSEPQIAFTGREQEVRRTARGAASTYGMRGERSALPEDEGDEREGGTADCHLVDSSRDHHRVAQPVSLHGELRRVADRLVRELVGHGAEHE